MVTSPTRGPGRPLSWCPARRPAWGQVDDGEAAPQEALEAVLTDGGVDADGYGNGLGYQEGQRPQLEGDGQAADNLVYHRAAGGEGIADYPVLPKPGAMVKVIVV